MTFELAEACPGSWWMFLPRLLAGAPEGVVTVFIVLVGCFVWLVNMWQSGTFLGAAVWPRVRQESVKLAVIMIIMFMLCWLPFTTYAHWIHTNHQAWCYGFLGNLFGFAVLFLGPPLCFVLQNKWLMSADGERFMAPIMAHWGEQ
jgi:hypothetical protein